MWLGIPESSSALTHLPTNRQEELMQQTDKEWVFMHIFRMCHKFRSNMCVEKDEILRNAVQNFGEPQKFAKHK